MANKKSRMEDINVKTVFRNKNNELTVGVGDVIKWSTIGGKVYQGEIIEMDSNVAFVRVKGHGTKPVEL